MDNLTESVQYNESLLLSELERRFYLFLIGGGYEKLFYTFNSEQTLSSREQVLNISRVRPELEVSAKERRMNSQGDCADPEYKSVLDYMLTQRINEQIEHQQDLLTTWPELADILPILKTLGGDTEFNETLFQTIENVPWLCTQIRRFSTHPIYAEKLAINHTNELRSILRTIGFPLFIWLLPRFCSEMLQRRTHHSMLPILQRLRQHGRFTAGAIAALIAQRNVGEHKTWQLYMLAGINSIPLFLLLNIINNETVRLLEQQRTQLQLNPKENADKLTVIQHYALAGDALRDVLCLEEILKPYIVETIGFTHFDPLPYLLGYAGDSPNAQLFFQARAYAFYRQLFKTGRIHPHETAILLRRYGINRAQLQRLNQTDLTSTESHIELHFKLQQAFTETMQQH